jgi:Asp-tRNA(Asn)/Glu-tRNA(Gln) amidotransferase A subunit family amidase
MRAEKTPAPEIDAGHMIELSRQINRNNSAWSVARLPALAIPSASNGLPVGVQLIRRPGGDWDLLSVGAAVQQHSEWHERIPLMA